jgi:hypothetical protein
MFKNITYDAKPIFITYTNHFNKTLFTIMNTTKIKSLIATVFALLFLSCSSDSSDDNSSNPSASTPIAANGTIVRGSTVYTINTIRGYGKTKEGSYLLDVDASTSTERVVFVLMLPDYLPNTASYSMDNNLSPMSSGKYGFSFSVNPIAGGPVFNYEVSLANHGGANLQVVKNSTSMQFYGNNVQAFKTDTTEGEVISFNITVDNATIPTANSSFTEPTDLSATATTIGTTTIDPTSTTYWKLISPGLSGSNTRGCKISLQNPTTFQILEFNFKDNLPLSGTYDIVTSLNSVTSGKVYVQYSLGVNFKLCTGAGTVTVVNTNGVIKVYAKNVGMSDGTNTELLNSFITF